MFAHQHAESGVPASYGHIFDDFRGEDHANASVPELWTGFDDDVADLERQRPVVSCGPEGPHLPAAQHRAIELPGSVSPPFVDRRRLIRTERMPTDQIDLVRTHWYFSVHFSRCLTSFDDSTMGGSVLSVASLETARERGCDTPVNVPSLP